MTNAPIHEQLVDLPAPTEGENVVADYASLGLTLGRHPLALLRSELGKLRLATARDIRHIPHGTPTRAAGIVTCRQRPGTASGVVFITLEDETGFINVVVWAGRPLPNAVYCWAHSWWLFMDILSAKVTSFISSQANSWITPLC